MWVVAWTVRRTHEGPARGQGTTEGVMTLTKLERIKADVEKLSPAQQFRLASELVAAGRVDLGMVIAENVVMKWRADKILSR